MQLILVRHGRTAWHTPNRYTGSSDIPLDSVGEQQAAELAAWARNASLTHLVSSPLRRTMATAEPASRATGLAIETLPALREVDFGIAEGRTIDELAAERPDAVAAFLADPVAGHWPGGDDPAERAELAVSTLRSIAAAHPDGQVLVVMHSTLIRLCVCLVLGIAPSAYRAALSRPDPVHACVLAVDHDVAQLVRYNTPLGSGS